MAIHNRIEYPVQSIQIWIDQGLTQQWIADVLQDFLDPRVTAKSVYKICRKHDIACQRTGPRSGEGHPRWSGGKTVARHGYVKVFCPDHPKCLEINARRAAKANGKYYPKHRYVWEHRLVMEKHLGRYLKPTEVVHHINGVKNDNRIENLIVFQTNAEHLAFDLKGRCPKWTPDGKERIRRGVEKLKANARLRKELSARQQQRTLPQS